MCLTWQTRGAQASQLRRLALYFDVGTQLWGERTAADWQAMSREDWDRLFEAGIAESAPSSPSSPSAKEPATAAKAGGGLQRTYVLKPVDGRLRYLRRGRDARKTEKEAVQEADLDLETISLHISRAPPFPPPCLVLLHVLGRVSG